MNIAAVAADGLPQGSYYAPDFNVEIEGQPFDAESKGDVLSLKLVMDLENMTSAEIELNNWDDRTFWFKYSDTDGVFVGNRVHIQMGYADRLVSMLRGEIERMAPKFPQSGSPTLSIAVLDDMQKLKDRRPVEGEQRQFRDMTFGQIAERIAQRNSLQTDIDPGGTEHAEVIQGDLDDAGFLLQLARRADAECYIYTGPDSGDATLRFGQPRDDRAGPRRDEFSFIWGQTLKSFTPTLTMSGQVQQVTVRGYDEDRMEEIVGIATADDIPGGAAGSSGPGNAETASGGRQDVIIGAAVETEEEARQLALSLLRQRAYEFITGSGEVIGLPELRPGDTVNLLNLGDRFSGSYYVKKVEHTIGAGGFSSKFDVRKSHAGDGA